MCLYWGTFWVLPVLEHVLGAIRGLGPPHPTCGVRFSLTLSCVAGLPTPLLTEPQFHQVLAVIHVLQEGCPNLSGKLRENALDHCFQHCGQEPDSST